MILACALDLCQPWSPCPCRRAVRTSRAAPWYEPWPGEDVPAATLVGELL